MFMLVTFKLCVETNKASVRSCCYFYCRKQCDQIGRICNHPNILNVSVTAIQSFIASIPVEGHELEVDRAPRPDLAGDGVDGEVAAHVAADDPVAHLIGDGAGTKI